MAMNLKAVLFVLGNTTTSINFNKLHIHGCTSHHKSLKYLHQ